MIRLYLALSGFATVALSYCGGSLPQEEASNFLDVHNKLRRKLSDGLLESRKYKLPPARVPLHDLTWDCKLEESAQAHANTCTNSHSQDTQRIGENMYYFKTFGKKITLTGWSQKAAQAWENEIEQYGWYDPKMNARTMSNVFHATQMVWSKTTKIGCGMHLCDGDTRVVIVCQYEEKGNIDGQYIYEPGNRYRSPNSEQTNRKTMNERQPNSNSISNSNTQLPSKNTPLHTDDVAWKDRMYIHVDDIQHEDLLNLDYGEVKEKDQNENDIEDSDNTCNDVIPRAELNDFLEVHNTLRKEISEGQFEARGKRMPAAKMSIPAMTWDCELARKAQIHSNTCEFQHSKEAQKNIGENLYFYNAFQKINLTGYAKEASKGWANEFQEYGWNDVIMTENMMQLPKGTLLHATQMAWAKTTKLGCGMTLCRGETYVLVVCKYLEKGNKQDEYIYEPR